MSTHRHPARRASDGARSRTLPALTVTLAAALVLAACSGGSQAATRSTTAADGTTTVQIASVAGSGGTATPIDVPVVDSIRAELPATVRDSGKLVIGIGALPSGFPPLAYVGTDNKTLTGSEPDLGRLVAAVLGLEPDVENATWDNLFVGIDSGKTDVGFSNITVTEERKEKYDFASYREDNLAFAVRESSTWSFDDDYENLAGLVVAVGSGTNQEKILLEWQKKLKAEGKNVTIKYFADTPSTWTALQSGQIDAYLGPNPGVAYEISQVKGTAKAVKNAGTYSGAGASLQGLIAATSKKGSGLAKPLADAINYLIDNGQYAKLLAAYNLSNEAVQKSEVNPAGLPLGNS